VRELGADEEAQRRDERGLAVQCRM
jgi:hypothetical protein